MRLLKLKTVFVIPLILLVIFSRSASGCPIPPPPEVTPPEWYYNLHKERPELYKLPEEAVKRLQRMAENRKLIHKGLITREEAVVRGLASHLTGTWRIPVVMGRFNNTPSAPFAFGTLQQELFNGPWPTGTLREFYTENSYGNFTFDGTVFDWVQVSQDDTYYEGPSGCNGVCSSARTGEFIKEILDQLDPVVDFSQFDNDGDGKVEALAVIHPEVDAVCGTSNIWAHRFSLTGLGIGLYVTNDGVTIDDYIIQGLYCDGTMTRIGTFAHELGHILGLPDLYDTDQSSEGLGNWALMANGDKGGGSTRPSHMCGWSKTQLGWLTPQNITSNQFNTTILPLENSPGALLRVDAFLPPSPEYFLLENRQLTGFDDGLPGSGLLIYHVDDNVGTNNNVNQLENCGPCVTAGHYRIALEQADGFCDFECNFNRGDTGDPFPGSSNNTTFDSLASPNSLAYNGSNSCVAVRNISISGQNIVADVMFLDPTDPACATTPTPTTSTTTTTTPTTTTTVPCQCPESSQCISGQVTLLDGTTPLSGKKVKIKGKSGAAKGTKDTQFTDTDGCYRFTNLSDGTYKIKVKKCKKGVKKRIVIMSGGTNLSSVNFTCKK